jgi:hypothetical protein
LGDAAAGAMDKHSVKSRLQYGCSKWAPVTSRSLYVSS